VSGKRRYAKKELMKAKKFLKQQQKQAIQKQQDDKKLLEWKNQNHWNYPNDYVALTFLAYNGIEKEISDTQVFELFCLMYGNISKNCHRNYWRYDCGYCENELWDYDRENGIFTRKQSTTTLDLVCRVVQSFDFTQLGAVFPEEVVQELLSMKLASERKNATLQK